MKLRNLYVLLLAVLLAMGAVSCGEDEKCKPCKGNNGGYTAPPRDTWMLLQFIDEEGKVLTLPESAIEVFSESPRGGHIKTEEYSLQRWCDDEKLPETDLYDTIYDLERKEIYMDMGGLLKKFFSGQFDIEAAYVFRSSFRCPALFGDDREHIIQVMKRGRQFTSLYMNNVDVVMFDGEVVATNPQKVERYGDPPLRIVVKR